MDVQFGGDGVPAPLVQQPTPQCLDKPGTRCRAEASQRLQCALPQILGGVSICTEHQLDQMLIGVHDTAGGGEVPAGFTVVDREQFLRDALGGGGADPEPAQADPDAVAVQLLLVIVTLPADASPTLSPEM